MVEVCIYTFWLSSHLGSTPIFQYLLGQSFMGKYDFIQFSVPQTVLEVLCFLYENYSHLAKMVFYSMMLQSYSGNLLLQQLQAAHNFSTLFHQACFQPNKGHLHKKHKFSNISKNCYANLCIK